MSIAAWYATYKLITAPHHWAKTQHGLHIGNNKAIKHATKAIGTNLIDDELINIPLSPAI